MAPSLIFSILFVLSITRADRADGLNNENPTSLPPEMYALFKPITQQPNMNKLCDSPDCSSLPLAANVHLTPAHEILPAGDIAGIPIGFIFACLILVGVYYVVIQRYANSQMAKLHNQGEV
ncbi:hypothetical protein CDL12_09848 [Handroanthus impetiginosus]|uniref:Uncharacterized protein n=1 Tax=Handroanthus impetiginosus TaxID=429701 RepID=A0A2G9HIZ5_9LAMI|nr:hypothetical protein CDL12_12308 [Handroanthus impetiginosus]PIN17502.1 hypothetical protein CDL12_09848 [Handroanthus impetiginosus]